MPVNLPKETPSSIKSFANKANDFRKKAKSFMDEYVFKPNAETGIGSVKMDIIGEQTLTTSSGVTDNYVESNIAYHDHISLKPVVYTIQGEVGELVYYKKPLIGGITGLVSGVMGTVSSFFPSVSKVAAQVSNIANKAAQILEDVDSVLTVLDKLDSTQTAQQKAYSSLMILWRIREPINITTPWSDLYNYCITDIKLTQPKETKDKTLISITLEEFRGVYLSKVPFDINKYQGRLQDQKAPVIEQGQTQGVTTSYLRNINDSLSGKK